MAWRGRVEEEDAAGRPPTGGRRLAADVPVVRAHPARGGVENVGFARAASIYAVAYLMSGVTTPVGLGAYEGILTGFMALQGVSPSSAAPAAILYRGFNEVFVVTAQRPCDPAPMGWARAEGNMPIATLSHPRGMPSCMPGHAGLSRRVSGAPGIAGAPIAHTPSTASPVQEGESEGSESLICRSRPPDTGSKLG